MAPVPRCRLGGRATCRNLRLGIGGTARLGVSNLSGHAVPKGFDLASIRPRASPIYTGVRSLARHNQCWDLVVARAGAGSHACKTKRAANSAALSSWRKVMKRTAGDGLCSYSKEVIQGVRCDPRHSNGHGTRSASRLANAFKNRSSKIGSRKLPARDPQEREHGCRCNAYQRLRRLRECPRLPPVTPMKRVQKLFPAN